MTKVKKKVPAKKTVEKKESSLKSTEEIKGVMYNNKPLYLLEDAFDEYKTTSNGDKFIVSLLLCGNMTIGMNKNL